MKKNIAILLLILYSSFNMGFVLNTHYCNGKLVSASLVNNEGCGLCGKKEIPKNCCTDKQVKLSVDDTHKLAESAFSLEVFYIAVLPDLNVYITPLEIAPVVNHVRFYEYATGPPKTPIYIQVRSLLI
jgi:hypothetical protein